MPSYADGELAALTPEALIELLIRDEDRVPRSAIDACAPAPMRWSSCLAAR
ncbi:MAG: hypothetical protein ACT4P3_05770 [Betaproteobacteria bacterium]